jgi:hypothetical protein
LFMSRETDVMMSDRSFLAPISNGRPHNQGKQRCVAQLPGFLDLPVLRFKKPDVEHRIACCRA